MNIEWHDFYDEMSSDEERIQSAEARFHSGATAQTVELMLEQIENRVWNATDQDAIKNLWVGLMELRYDLHWLWSSFELTDEDEAGILANLIYLEAE